MQFPFAFYADGREENSYRPISRVSLLPVNDARAKLLFLIIAAQQGNTRHGTIDTSKWLIHTTDED